MLRQKNVVSEMIDMIKETQNESMFKEYILAGGTALTLQIGHRTSTDIDLFTIEKMNSPELVKYFKKKYENCNPVIANDEFIRLFANDIKVELVCSKEKYIKEPVVQDGIKMFGLEDISAMKLSAITGRTKARDFIDVAYLLQNYSLKNMFEFYREKYGQISPLYIKRTLLVKSMTINDDEWLVDITMLKNDIEPKSIPLLLERAIAKYNEEVGVGISGNNNSVS